MLSLYSSAISFLSSFPFSAASSSSNGASILSTFAVPRGQGGLSNDVYEPPLCGITTTWRVTVRGWVGLAVTHNWHECRATAVWTATEPAASRAAPSAAGAASISWPRGRKHLVRLDTGIRTARHDNGCRRGSSVQATRHVDSQRAFFACARITSCFKCVSVTIRRHLLLVCR